MQLLYVIGTGVLAAFCVLLAVRICYQRRYIRTSDRINDCIFRNVAAYLLLIDPDFNVLQTNYRSATGTAPKAVPPKVGNLLRCRNGEDAGVCGTHELCADCPVRAAITGVFRTKKGFSGLEVPMVLYTSDDRTATVDCDVSVAGNFLTVAGHPRVVLTVSDISAQKRTLRELEKARVRAEESDRMKSRFLANMSHELRTPLNAIIGFSELLMDDPAPTEKQEYMRIIRSNGEVLMQQLSDILDLSKIEAGTLGYEYTDVELNAVMEELEGGFRMRQPKNSPVRITFHRKYPVRYIRTDRKRLIQVIANFLSNAVKFTSEGSVDFGFEIRGGELYVYVADTGAGIPEEHREQLFQRFVKAGSFRQGIGIGLTISKSIVETMGGRIGVESRPGKGFPASRSNKHRYPLRGFQTVPALRSGIKYACSFQTPPTHQASQRDTERNARRAACNSGSAGSLTTGLPFSDNSRARSIRTTRPVESAAKTTYSDSRSGDFPT